MFLKGWKTVILSSVLAILGILQATDITTLVSDPKTAGVVAAVIGVVFGILRKFTDTSIGNK